MWNQKTKVLLISANCPEAGKSTAARIITAVFKERNKGVETLAFAHPIKTMIRGLLLGLGMTTKETEPYLYGDKKEVVIPQLGTTTRFMMQKLGTEWRMMINPQMWGIIGNTNAELLIRCLNPVLILMDDYRFPGEEDVQLRSNPKLDVKHLHILNPVREEAYQATHRSELPVQTAQPDFTLVNDGTVEEFEQKVRDWALTTFGLTL